MIGLKRHTVRLVPYDPAWAALGAQEVARLREVAGPRLVDAQHVGSTAVPGLPAKPILDLAAAVAAPAAVAPVVALLVACGYQDRGDAGREGGYLLVRDLAPEVRWVHLHVVTGDDPQWHAYLAFRDRLRADAALRNHYAALKQELAATYPRDRLAYTAGKAEFIRAALADRGRPEPTRS